jgi:hypothetical protein
VTLDSGSANTLPLPTRPAPGKTIAKASAKKPESKYVVAAVVAVLAMMGAWYALRNKNGVKETASTAPEVSAIPQQQPPAPAPAAPLVETKPAETKPAVLSPGKDAENADTKMGAIAPAKSRQPASQPANVDFDPKLLNPKENARLKIDANQMPANLDFAIELNGKTYFRRSTAGSKAEYEDLFVPPGVQEFRVTALSNGIQKVSNIASTEFKAKKKKTLKIELRTQGKSASAGMPGDLYPDSQLVVTLK